MGRTKDSEQGTKDDEWLLTYYTVSKSAVAAPQGGSSGPLEKPV